MEEDSSIFDVDAESTGHHSFEHVVIIKLAGSNENEPPLCANRAISKSL
jgi:hypothetical protein